VLHMSTFCSLTRPIYLVLCSLTFSLCGCSPST
jgi:hypothetical protein